MEKPAERPRHVRRLHTAAEIEADTDRCLVCGAPAHGTYGMDFAAGASTLDLDRPPPDVPLCAECVAAQSRAMVSGERAIFVGLFVPPLLLLVAVVLAPLGTPVVLLALAGTSLMALRALVTFVGRRRAYEARLLYLDGAGDDVLLQLRLSAQRPVTPGYRTLAREVPAAEGDEEVAKPRGPRVRMTIGLVLSTLATGLVTLVGWFGAYPFLVLDNPGGEPVVATVDGRMRYAIAPGGKAVVTVGYGRHHVSFTRGPNAESDVHVGFGQSHLVGNDVSQCYEVTFRDPARGVVYDRTDYGPVVRIDDPKDVRRVLCPTWPSFSF